MSVLSRFSPSPLRSRDAAVRLKAVRKHRPEDADTLADLARSDPDPAVRREAVRRIEAPRVLLDLVATAGDGESRNLARQRSGTLLVRIAADDRDLGESRRALGLLDSLSGVADVVCRARFEPVRDEALSRVLAADGEGEAAAVRETALARVAARGSDPAIRGRALAAIRTAAVLAQVATTARARGTAQAAVRRISDPDELLRVATSGASRSVRRLARRLADERLPADHPERVAARERALKPILTRLDADSMTPAAQRRRLREAEALLRSGPVSPESEARLEAARARIREAAARQEEAAARLRPPPKRVPAPPPAPVEWRAPPEVIEMLERLESSEAPTSFGDLAEIEPRLMAAVVAAPSDAPIRRRIEAALRGARARAREHRRRRSDAFDLVEMADQAEALAKRLGRAAEGESPGGRRSRWDAVRGRRELSRLERRFQRSSVQEGDDAERFREAAEKADALLAGAEAVREAAEKKRNERLAALDARLDELDAGLDGKASFAPDEVEKTLRELGALRGKGDLWRSAGPSRRARVERLQAALVPKLREARELREWKQWSNLGVQTDIIGRGRALLEEEDPARVDRELKGLDRAWREARHTNPERGQELWEEWREVRAGLLERAAPVREARAREIEEKVEALETLAARAEAFADAFDPARVEEMRALMPEWKVQSRGLPRRRSDAAWKRFRAANDRFFAAMAERRAAGKKRYEELAANIPAREALIARAKELEATASPATVDGSVRALIAAWKEAPPVPRKAGDRLWKAFSGALDAARDAARARQFARSERGGAADRTPPAAELDGLREEVARIAALPLGERAAAAASVFAGLRKLQRAGTAARSAASIPADFGKALSEAFETAPDTFVGTRFDQGELLDRLKKLDRRLDRLAPSSPAPAPEETGIAFLAARLQRSLGAGRPADRDAAARETAMAAARLIERAHAAGPALSPAARKALGSLERRARKLIAAAPPPPDSRSRGRGFRSRPGRRPRTRRSARPASAATGG